MDSRSGGARATPRQQMGVGPAAHRGRRSHLGARPRLGRLVALPQPSPDRPRRPLTTTSRRRLTRRPTVVGRLACRPTDPGPPPSTASPSAQEIVVDVAGKVRRPGLVRTTPGSRVADVLALAGGALPGVDLTTLNLARQVTDGEQILVGIPGAPPPTTPGAGDRPLPDAQLHPRRPQQGNPRRPRSPPRRRPGPGPANPRLANRTRPLHHRRRTPRGLRRRPKEVRLPKTPCPRLTPPLQPPTVDQPGSTVEESGRSAPTARGGSGGTVGCAVVGAGGGLGGRLRWC